MRAAVITVSTSKAQNSAGDKSGPLLKRLSEAAGADVTGTEIVPDDRRLLEERLCYWADRGNCDLVLTTGGTGFAPDDVTPEATLAVVDRPAPGIGETMRAASAERTPNAMLSRAQAGIRGRTLIINFPGSPRGVRECFDAIVGSLAHAITLLRGEHASHDQH